MAFPCNYDLLHEVELGYSRMCILMVSSKFWSLEHSGS